MPNDFAIVAEGITDQIVLKNILLGFFNQQEEEPAIVFEQPLQDFTVRSGPVPPGGWTLVVKYFLERKFLQALQLNKYVVVHIDTDIVDDLNVPRIAEGRPRTPAELVQAVIAHFQGLIGQPALDSYGERFLFAIAVDEIECWLLPLVFDRSAKAKLTKTTGCLTAVNDKLRAANKPVLGSSVAKDRDAYRVISEAFQDRKAVMGAAAHNPGFERFVQQLAAAKI